jgi:uncharacterized protein YcnI
MKRLALLLVLALGGLLALAGPASAHVTVSSTNAVPGGYATVALKVPTESDTASTTKLVVQLPPVGSVSVQPTPGWSFAAKKTKLAQPITTDDGPITTTVSQLTFTASASGIKPGEFQQFFISLGPLPKASSVSFPTLQYYSDGTVARWIEKAAPGSSAEPERPAPTLTLSAATKPAAATTKVEKASTTGATVLAIVALVVAAGALGFAFVSRARAKEPAP